MSSESLAAKIKALLAKFRPPDRLNLENASTALEVRTAILGYLRTHRAWYVRWSRFYSFAWNLATLLIVVLGAATAILTAWEEAKVDRWILVALPALSSLFAALLMQFRLKESCRVRERGRIAIEELMCRAYLIPLDDLAAALRQAIAIRLEAHQIEKLQLVEFLGEPVPPGKATANGHQPALPSS